MKRILYILLALLLVGCKPNNNSDDKVVIDEVLVEVDYQTYEIKTLSNGYEAKLDSDQKVITITIDILEGYTLKEGFKFKINNDIILSGYTLNNRRITYTMDDPNDEKIHLIKVVANYQNYTIDAQTPSIKATLTKGDKIILITISLDEGYVLDENFVLTINDSTIENYTLSNGVITLEVEDPNNHEITTILLLADYQKYTVDVLSEGVEATLKTDQQTITITIKVKDTYTLAETFILKINDVIQNNYTIVDGTITYTIEDPNWTKPY